MITIYTQIMNIKVLIFSYANILRLLLFSFLSNSAPNPADATDTMQCLPWNTPYEFLLAKVSLTHTLSLSPNCSEKTRRFVAILKKGIQKNLMIETWHYFVVQTDSHGNRGMLLPLITEVRWMEPIIHIFLFISLPSRVPFSPISIASLEPDSTIYSWTIHWYSFFQ